MMIFTLISVIVLRNFFTTQILKWCIIICLGSVMQCYLCQSSCYEKAKVLEAKFLLLEPKDGQTSGIHPTRQARISALL